MVVGSSLGYPSWWATSWRSKSGLHQLSLVAQQRFLTVLFSWHKQTDTTFVLLRPHSLKAQMPSWWVGSWNCAAPTADFLSGKLPSKHHWDEQEGVWVWSSETGLWLWLCFGSSSFPNCRLWTQIVLGILRMEEKACASSVQGTVIRVDHFQASIAFELKEERIHNRVFLCWKIVRDSLLVQLHHYPSLSAFFYRSFTHIGRLTHFFIFGQFSQMPILKICFIRR